MTIFHIVAPADWAAAQADGQYRAPSLASEGFIHCSYRDQVAATLQRHYRGVRGLIVVELDPAAIDSPVIVEHSADAGESFPHVYGPIRTAAAVRTHDADEWPAVSDPNGPGGAASPDR